MLLLRKAKTTVELKSYLGVVPVGTVFQAASVSYGWWRGDDYFCPCEGLLATDINRDHFVFLPPGA